ncbi:Lsr2 family protein [Streptomyces thermolineatus]|uniref:histone-like nucleoid-structuring protein Lsr2 n=1 Tax=Streptomyces thermolineatus TaxID=44033 RepID=UPI00385039E1
MAKRFIIESDLSGEPDAESVSFAFDGKGYTVDLTESEKEEFARLLARYIDVAEEEVGAGQAGIPNRNSEPDPSVVRKWALENGIEVNAKGRIPHSVVARYKNSMTETADA